MVIYTQTEIYEILYGLKSEVFFIKLKNKEDVEPMEFKYAAEAIVYAEERLCK